MRGAKIGTILIVQIHFALAQWWDGSSGWSYAPPYFVPYVPEQSTNQYGQPVYFGPPQDYTTQSNSYMYPQGPSDMQFYPGYGPWLPEASCGSIPYGSQPGYFNPIPGAEYPPCIQANGEPVILLPESNHGVKYVPPVPCDNTSPYPYMPPIIIINDDDDHNNGLFDSDDGNGHFGLGKFLALLWAIHGKKDGDLFSSQPPPPPPPPPANWGSPDSGQNCCCCCCCKKCKCCDSNDENPKKNNQGYSSCSNGGTTTHITIVLPKSWGVSQNNN